MSAPPPRHASRAATTGPSRAETTPIHASRASATTGPSRAAAIPAALAASLLVCVLGSAALAPWLARPPAERPLDPEELDALAQGRPPGEALLLGRALPADGTSAAEWQLVPGIGPRLADALVEARPRTLDEVLAVRGIGPARRATLSGLVRAPCTPAAAPEPAGATGPSPTPGRPCRSP